MNFISNKILHSVSTMQTMAAKQERKKSALSSSFLNTKISQKAEIRTGSKQSINWQINDSHSIPLMNYFTNHNNMIIAEIESSLTQLQIIMDRIQNKAMNEQASIEIVYKQLKQLERIITVQLKQLSSDSHQSDKQQMKNILTKIKSLFLTVSQKLASTIDFMQPINYFRQEIDQTFPLLFQNENKQRQKQWEQQIDALSHVMFDLQSEIHQMQNQTLQKHKLFQQQVKNLHSCMIEVIVEEKQITNYQHDVIMQLINSAAQRMVYI